MTPAQCQAARGMPDWTQAKLAAVAGLGNSPVISFERNQRPVSAEAIQAMRAALEKACVEFINGDEPGVKLRKGKPE